MKKIKSIVLFGLIAILLLTCDIGLGTMLDLNGPMVEILSPVPRKAVSAVFTLEGTASDERVIEIFLVTASREGKDFPKQWRYANNKWEVSENSGANWSDYTVEGLSWIKGNDGIINWKLPVDLSLNGNDPEDGEYLFIVQAWDSGGVTDDNSIKSRVLIIDKNPPKVDIVSPVLYRGIDAWNNPPLKPLHDISDDAALEPANIGKFISQAFTMQWQVEDNHDIWSIDIRFYDFDAEIDQTPETPLPENYIFKYYENLPPPPATINPGDILKPNGKVEVPELDHPVKSYDGELKNPITGKTTIKVVATCYDAAGNANQEKVLGYFIYWPKADVPWIVYTEGMEPPEFYEEKADGISMTIEDVLKEEAFMIYPGRTIRATAYHNHGVQKVEFDLYTYDELLGKISDAPIADFTGRVIDNDPRPNGSFSTIFPWELRPPARSGYFVVKAKTTSVNGKVSEEHISLFRVQDISFPDFPEPIKPSASDPLFMHVSVENNTITISGIVRDATLVETLDMVWINPQSKGYATQSQIRYFREPDFDGWKKADEANGNKGLVPGGACIEEDILESVGNTSGTTYPNKIWRLELIKEDEDPETQRQVFSFSRTINLNDFNIGVGNQPLKSQTFLFKARNPDNRSTIITYAPQGDESPPVLNITNVEIKDGEGNTSSYIPQSYALIPRFNGGERITINGTWREDSAKYLPIRDYFSDNFKADINGINLSNITVSHYPSSHPYSETEGTWTVVVDVVPSIQIPVIGQISANNLRDSLVIAANTRDIGGNVSEAGGSWLIESDDLRLLRISSDDEKNGNKGTFREGDKIIIFLEFSKAVNLKFAGSNPVLTLNSTGTGIPAEAVYIPNPSQSTKQEFEYTVRAGHTTGADGRLNVTGITAGAAWNQNNYPFTWVRGSDDKYEEIRVTMNPGHTGTSISNSSVTPAATSGRVYARQLPVTTISADSDHQFTLAAGKNIRIDTEAPRVESIVDSLSNTTGELHHSTGDIFIKVTFSENVQIGNATPRLQLQLQGSTVYTSDNSNDVRISGREMTFKYTIQTGNTTGANPIRIVSYTGQITDLAGTPLAANGISSLPEGTAASTATNDRTIQNRFINTLAPGVPTIRLLSAENINNVVTNIVGTTTHTGNSSAANRSLSNVYAPQLYLAIESNNSSATGAVTFTGSNNLQANTGLEYSINGGTSWVRAPNTSNSPFSGLLPGTYTLIARQINRAGIESASTNAITFTWDPGELITRISSTVANGTYTSATGRNQITITVYFRKNVSIAAGSTITLNARRGAAGSNFSAANPEVQLTGAVVNNANSITYTYNIQNGENTPNTGTALQQLLDVTGINITAWDGTTPSNGVRNDITSITLSAPDRLNGSKEFKVSTGNLTNTAPVFSADSGVETDSNFHGIRTDDGSYWTTLEIPFNRPVSKGTGNIVIEQVAANYRVPTVLTETQYNRFRGVANFDTYYFKGTNGYIFTSADDQGADTTSKYILQYNYNPSSAVTANNSAFTGDAFIPPAFFTAFREAERITIPVAAQAVTIDGNTVKIRLSGSNAPQVPGATYAVTYPAGFVQDELGNLSPAAASVNVTLRGVAKPFVRIRKTQDTISVNDSPSMTQPRFVATQPLLAYARMDCRTPGSTIRPVITSGYSNTTGVSGTNANQNNWSTAGNPNDMTGTTATRPAAPTTTTEAGDSATQTTLGTNTGTNAIQGYMWWVRAIATTETTNIVSSREAEEVAFRTVITYQLRHGADRGANGGGNEAEMTATAAQGEAVMTAGESIWIRGGDAIGSSSIPGFPITWEENWNTVSGRRAGIRLMSKVNAGNNDPNTGSSLNNSIWRYITWDINTTAYVDFVKGNDTVSNANTAWQYGPVQWAYQRSGWTSFKIKYPIYPGKHRWCDTGHDWAGKYALNFSGTYSGRPTNLTADYGTGINTP